MNNPLRSLSIALWIAASGAAPLAAQAGVIVDASGASSPYRTITAGLAATTHDDIIRVKKGVYVEDLILNGRAANIVSIAASPTDVVLRGAKPASTPLKILNHPAGRTSRFARMVIDNGNPLLQSADGISVDKSAGNLVFEGIHTESRCSIRNHRGLVSFTRCTIKPRREGSYHLLLDNVDRAFLHLCSLSPQYTNTYFIGPTIYPGTVVNTSNVEFSRCNLRGSNFGSYTILYTGGGPALTVTNSSCRISGLTADQIVGGAGHQSSIPSRKTQGGSGIIATRSTLVISEVRVKAGPGVNFINQPAPDILNTGSTITRPTTMLPIVQNTSGFTRGMVEKIEVFGPANADSITWIALSFAPFQLPFGFLLIDPSGPVLELPGKLSATGRFSHTLDLRSLPATFTGAPYVMQTITLTSRNTVGLSSPQIGAIASR